MNAITTTGQPAASPRPEDDGGTAPGTPPGATISHLRERIDDIDDALIGLWLERAALSQRVGTARVAAGGTRLALSREREILDRYRSALGAIGAELALLVLRAGRGRL
jgi:chorismate mutase